MFEKSPNCMTLRVLSFTLMIASICYGQSKAETSVGAKGKSICDSIRSEVEEALHEDLLHDLTSNMTARVVSLNGWGESVAMVETVASSNRFRVLDLDDYMVVQYLNHSSLFEEGDNPRHIIEKATEKLLGAKYMLPAPSSAQNNQRVSISTLPESDIVFCIYAPKGSNLSHDLVYVLVDKSFCVVVMRKSGARPALFSYFKFEGLTALGEEKACFVRPLLSRISVSSCIPAPLLNGCMEPTDKCEIKDFGSFGMPSGNKGQSTQSTVLKGSFWFSPPATSVNQSYSRPSQV